MIKMLVHNFSLVYGIFKFMISCLILPFKLFGGIFNQNYVPKKRRVVYKKSNFDRESDLYHLSNYDRKLALEERMSPSEFIEAEENDDDNLDNDD